MTLCEDLLYNEADFLMCIACPKDKVLSQRKRPWPTLDKWIPHTNPEFNIFSFWNIQYGFLVCSLMHRWLKWSILGYLRYDDIVTISAQLRKDKYVNQSGLIYFNSKIDMLDKKVGRKKWRRYSLKIKVMQRNQWSPRVMSVRSWVFHSNRLNTNTIVFS